MTDALEDARRSGMSEVSVTEIHHYPLAPEGAEEPLWRTAEWKRSVADHLASSSWLCRASEIRTRVGSGQAAHAAEERVYVLARKRGTFVVRRDRPSGTSSRGPWRKRRVVEIIDLWREIGAWWSGEDSVDWMVFRVLLSGGRVVDLARNWSDDWSLVGVVD